MSSFGILHIADVIAVLTACAPGHEITATEHYYRIRWNNKTYPSLPLGEHGRKRKALRSEIKVGDVRKMIRQLGIPLPCAVKAVPRLGQ